LGEGDLDASFLKLIIEPFDQGPSDQIGIVSLILLTKSKSYNSHSSVDIATPLASDALSGDESHPDPQINNIEKRMGALEELKRERAQNEVRNGVPLLLTSFYSLIKPQTMSSLDYH
jgi:hypothetical protein